MRLVDLSTSASHSGADIPAHQIAAFHPRGPNGVFTGDRGQSIAGMTTAFEAWIVRQQRHRRHHRRPAARGSTALAPGHAAAARGLPKLMVSTVASGNVAPYVGGSDILMMHSVTDVQGLNRSSREVLANAANAMAGMVRRAAGGRGGRGPTSRRVGLTMFGVTTPCVQRARQARSRTAFDCLVFHATGTGGQSMEKLIDSGC